jgi:hypothetical protein
MAGDYPLTPDGRYFLVGGRLWRAPSPALPEPRRAELVVQLMHARRAVKDAKRGRGDLARARLAVNNAKIALGERGPVWWDDGAPDYNRHLVKNTPYAYWGRSAVLEKERGRDGQEARTGAPCD